MKLEFKPVKPAPAFDLTPSSDWNSWIWQLRQSLTDAKDFKNVFRLREDEEKGFLSSQQIFKVAATPYYASLAASLEPQDHLDAHFANPLRRIMMPLAVENEMGAQALLDPLAEEVHSPGKNLIHRYSDRVLFLVTDTCSVYCRFCTRKRFTGQESGFIKSHEYRQALEYIQTHSGIREVILSGGDPLTLSNQMLERVLKDIRAIEHVEIIRIGSRMPVVCPMRIDEGLVKILRENGPVFMMSHFSHPKELTKEAAGGLALLIDNGIPVFNQMVLLNGVNNDAGIIQALNRRLLYLRVKPYYMFQCDPSEGTDHLRTTIESSEAILRELWGHMSGLAMPTLSLDIPNGGGKTSLSPNFMTSKTEDQREYQGWDGRKGVYQNPKAEVLVPGDAADYSLEWELLKNAKIKDSRDCLEQDLKFYS